MAFSETRQRRRSGSIFWLLGAAALAGAGAALPLGLAVAFLHPPRVPHRRTPRALGLPYERIALRTADGLRLSAWYVPPAIPRPRGAIVLCHGYFGNRAKMLPHLNFLHAAGYAVLLFDFRAHGWSGGRRATFGRTETLDLRAAIDWFLEQPGWDDVPIAVLGESMGGSVALLEAADDPRVRAVIADSAFARFDSAMQRRIELLVGPRVAPLLIPPTQVFGERLLGARASEIAPVDAVARIAPRPILLIHGTGDALIVHENARRLLAAAPGNATLWEVEGAPHVGSIAVAPDAYAEHVLSFLAEAFA